MALFETQLSCWQVQRLLIPVVQIALDLRLALKPKQMLKTTVSNTSAVMQNQCLR